MCTKNALTSDEGHYNRGLRPAMVATIKRNNDAIAHASGPGSILQPSSLEEKKKAKKF